MKNILKTFSEDVTREIKIRIKRERLVEDEKLITAGKLPAGAKPYKVPVGVKLMDEPIYDAAMDETFTVPRGTSHAAAREQFHLWCIGINSKWDRMLAAKQEVILIRLTSLEPLTEAFKTALQDYNDAMDKTLGEHHTLPPGLHAPHELALAQIAKNSWSKEWEKANIDKMRIQQRDLKMKERDAEILKEVGSRDPRGEFIAAVGDAITELSRPTKPKQYKGLDALGLHLDTTETRRQNDARHQAFKTAQYLAQAAGADVPQEGPEPSPEPKPETFYAPGNARAGGKAPTQPKPKGKDSKPKGKGKGKGPPPSKPGKAKGKGKGGKTAAGGKGAAGKGTSPGSAKGKKHGGNNGGGKR